jgi:hypothetical protein
MTTERTSVEAPPAGHPYAEAIEAERAGWYELNALVRELSPDA